MLSETYEFTKFRRISPSGDMDFVFREGDRLTNASITKNKRGKLTVRLRVRRFGRVGVGDEVFEPVEEMRRE